MIKGSRGKVEQLWCKQIIGLGAAEEAKLGVSNRVSGIKDQNDYKLAYKEWLKGNLGEL